MSYYDEWFYVGDFYPSVRLANCIIGAGFKSLPEVVAKLDDDAGFFLRLPNFGHKSLEELRALADYWKSNQHLALHLLPMDEAMLVAYNAT